LGTAWRDVWLYWRRRECSHVNPQSRPRKPTPHGRGQACALIRGQKVDAIAFSIHCSCLETIWGWMKVKSKRPRMTSAFSHVFKRRRLDAMMREVG
jgi:hypothetical protein